MMNPMLNNLQESIRSPTLDHLKYPEPAHVRGGHGMMYPKPGNFAAQTGNMMSRNDVGPLNGRTQFPPHKVRKEPDPDHVPIEVSYTYW